jgi:hypothetical protein
MVKLLPQQQAALVRDRPATFQPFNGAWGRGGATKVILQEARTAEVRKALRAAWEHVAVAAVPAKRKPKTRGR